MPLDVGCPQRSYALPVFFITRSAPVIAEVKDFPSRPWLGAIGIPLG